MCGGYCGRWDGVASDPVGEPRNGMRKPLPSGSGRSGPGLKKSPQREAHHRLHRRKWIERATASLPNLGPARTDAGAAVPLQLEDVVGDGRGDVVELLFSSVSGKHSQPAGGGVSGTSAAPHRWQVAGGVGRIAESPQQAGVGVCTPTERQVMAGVSSRLCSGTQSGGVFVGTLETARVTELMSGGLCRVELRSAPSLTSNAPSANADLCILGTSGTISFVTILCDVQ